MKLTFLGATQTVTGSRFLLESAGFRVLIDCGLFQGLKALRLRNWEPFPVDPASIDALILTHAHIDHTGYVPRLVRLGFRGPIYGTSATVDLLRILLPDSAYLQEEEARYRNAHAATKHKPALPLYTVEDADAALRLVRPAGYRTPQPLAPGLSFDLLPAGHILGSAFVRFRVEEKGREEKTVLFTGDIGRIGTPIIKDPAKVVGADYLIMESTYGNRLHDGAPGSGGKNQLRDTIVRTADRGGSVLIPSFAIGRAQEVLYYLRELENERQIPVLPFFIDSPMAVEAFELFRDHREEHDLKMRALDRSGLHPLTTRDVHFCRSVEESKAINTHRLPAIVISASGMATGGRVVHHLTRMVSDARNAVVFVGFQAAGTRGRDLVDGAKTIKLFGSEFPVRAEIHSLGGFSAHGDYNEILAWLDGFETAPVKTFLVHGEPQALEGMKERIAEKHRDWPVVAPQYLESVEL
jgi:metallo-beta-lactamase family protein